MKKLLLITSLFCCIAFVGACQSHSKSASKSSKKSGASKSATQTTGNGSSSSNSSAKKDSSATGSSTAIIQGQANQAQLDSLKKAKTKSKLKK